MRKDMDKVIVERGRVGGHGVRKGRAKDVEDLPNRESMARRAPKRGYNSKELNETLSPLKRYLRKQVGRPWNKVWSEISKNLRVTSAVQQHVRDHVWDYVERDVEMRGKKAYPSKDRWGTRYPLRPGELYIHPDTGLLCRVKR